MLNIPLKLDSSFLRPWACVPAASGALSRAQVFSLKEIQVSEELQEPSHLPCYYT